MTDDPELLASAYLDGDVTAEERARVDGDPEIVARVEAMRTVRDELRRVEPLADARASDLIARALTGPAAARARPHAIVGRPRVAWNRWLAAAAAVVAIVAAGVVVASSLNRTSSGDDDAATLAVADDTSEQDDGAAGGADVARTESAEQSEGAPAPFATEGAGEVAADEFAESTEAPAADSPTYDALSTVVIVGPDELVAYVTTSATQDSDPAPAPTVASLMCPLEPDQRYVGAATYAAVPGGLERDVIVVVDETADVASAIDVTTCQPVATVPVD